MYILVKTPWYKNIYHELRCFNCDEDKKNILALYKEYKRFNDE